MAKHSGSCLCGAVTFEVTGEFDDFYLCHCSRCRKDTGSAHGANLFSTTARLRWITGQERVTVFTLSGTQHTRAFCSTCGSALPTVQGEGALLVVPAGSLDDDVPIAPSAHIFVASRANWDSELHRLPMADGPPEPR